MVKGGEPTVTSILTSMFLHHSQFAYMEKKTPKDDRSYAERGREGQVTKPERPLYQIPSGRNMGLITPSPLGSRQAPTTPLPYSSKALDFVKPKSPPELKTPSGSRAKTAQENDAQVS